MFEIERLSVHCIYLCKRWALILEKNATHYWTMCPFLLYLSEVNMRPEVLWNVKFCAIHFAKLLTRFSFSEQVHCQSKHPVEQALPSIYDSAGGRFPRQASNFVKQSSNSNMKHHEENVLSWPGTGTRKCIHFWVRGISEVRIFRVLENRSNQCVQKKLMSCKIVNVSNPKIVARTSKQRDTPEVLKRNISVSFERWKKAQFIFTIAVWRLKVSYWHYIASKSVLLTLYYIASKSVLLTLYSVKKCLIDTI